MTALWPLVVAQLAMGLFDILYHHEMTERIAWRRSQRRELKLHGARNLAYAALFLVLGLTELDQRDAVLEIALELLVGVDRALELLTLAHDLLRRLGIVPELGILGPVVELGQPGVSGIPVKDASAGGRGPP